MKTVKVKKDKKTGEQYLDLKQVLKGTNITLKDVIFYQMEEKDGIITLKLYDKDKKQLVVKDEKIGKA